MLPSQSHNQKTTRALQEKMNKIHDFNKITAQEIIVLIPEIFELFQSYKKQYAVKRKLR